RLNIFGLYWFDHTQNPPVRRTITEKIHPHDGVTVPLVADFDGDGDNDVMTFSRSADQVIWIDKGPDLTPWPSEAVQKGQTGNYEHVAAVPAENAAYEVAIIYTNANRAYIYTPYTGNGYEQWVQRQQFTTTRTWGKPIV